MRLTVFFLFVALTAGAQTTAEHLPVTDAEKIADALRAAPNFITDGATIVDYPASKGRRISNPPLRATVNGLACPVHHPAPSMTPRDVSIVFFFLWLKDDLAGRPRHIARLGISYMYMGQWVPSAPGGEFHVGPHIMVVTPHPEDLKGFTSGGWNGTYIIHLPGADQADQWFLVIPIHQAENR